MQFEVHAAKKAVTNFNVFKNKVKNEGRGGEGKYTKF